MIKDGLIKMREGHLEGRSCWRDSREGDSREEGSLVVGVDFPGREGREELSVDSVDHGEVFDVLEQHGGLHHVAVVTPRSLEEVSC